MRKKGPVGLIVKKQGKVRFAAGGVSKNAGCRKILGSLRGSQFDADVLCSVCGVVGRKKA